MEYISCPDAAKKWKISERQVQKLCEDGRIPGIIKFGRMWMIPRDSQKPTDPRKAAQLELMRFTRNLISLAVCLISKGAETISPKGRMIATILFPLETSIPTAFINLSLLKNYCNG